MATHGMTAAEVVTQLRAEVEAATQLTISAGIAPNRMLAKVRSDRASMQLTKDLLRSEQAQRAV